MPQMSPLMWMELFAVFSLMLLMSMLKIYFSPSEPLISLSSTNMIEMNPLKIKWVW